MLSPDKKRLAEFCLETSAKAVDGDGFVPVRKLVETFGAEIEARPLLVEAMIAAPKTNGAKWKVLLDANSSRFEQAAYDNENSQTPLGTRLRFSVAHELGHILAFRPDNFGVRLREREKGKNHDGLVDRLEKETDGLSPLLLIADSALAAECGGGRWRLAQIIAARKRWAVSREALISRLSLLHSIDAQGLRYRSALRGIGLGLAEWQSAEKLALLEWPNPFMNFDGGLWPEFLLGEKGHRGTRAAAAFSGATFCLNGGRELAAEATVHAGTTANPRTDLLQLRLEFEDVPRRKGAKCLFLVTVA